MKVVPNPLPLLKKSLVGRFMRSIFSRCQQTASCVGLMRAPRCVAVLGWASVDWPRGYFLHAERVGLRFAHEPA